MLEFIDQWVVTDMTGITLKIPENGNIFVADNALSKALQKGNIVINGIVQENNLINSLFLFIL